MKSPIKPASYLLSFVALSISLLGQSAPTTTTTKQTPPTNQLKITPVTSTPNKEEKIISLSPFTVNSDDDEGYRAQNTLAGSRLNSSLNDTPAVLDVLTKDFLDDIGATSLEKALAFSANFDVDNGDFESQAGVNSVFSGPAATTIFRTRGLSGTLARNYLETDFRPSFYTIERIDNSSGPNSILFGLGGAGGVANVSTKAAKLNKNTYGLDFLTDGFGSKQVALDINRVLISQKLALRVNAIGSRLNKYRSNLEDNTDGVQLASTWRAGERTEVSIEYERAHINGTVAYPTAHTEQVSKWLALGSPVAALPVGWETLTAAARTAVASPLSLAVVAASPVAPVLVDNGKSSYILNAATAITGSTTAGGVNIPSINPALYNSRGNINGPGGRKNVHRDILAVSINQKLRENLYLNLSAMHESGAADTMQAYANGAASGATILGDANATLPNANQISNLGSNNFTTNAAGQVINPFAGKLYTQSRWVHRTQFNSRHVIQATMAYQFDLGRWFGSHRLVGTASYVEKVIDSEAFADAWLKAPFNADPINVANQVMRRRYASPLDASYFHVPDWRNFQVLSWNSPNGPISSGWISTGPQHRTVRQIAYLSALQSYFFNRRLVTTIGYRVDDTTDYVYAAKKTFPAGYEASLGINAVDYNKIAKTNARGPTQTLGAVLHITSWVSAYANRSSNFGYANGTVVGPDAMVGPTTLGKGLDTGLKFNFLQNKVALEVGYFDTSNNNVTEILNLNTRDSLSIAGAYNMVFTALGNPAGATPLFNVNDAAAVAALKSAYPLLRPTFNAQGDLLDQASRGYEARLTANPFKGMRLRATYAKTERNRENLYKYSFDMAAQLRTYVADIQKKNPGVNVGNFSSAADPTTIAQSVDNFEARLNLADFNNGAVYGGGGDSINLAATYDFQRILKGFGTTLTTLYKSGAYTGIYETREGGVAAGKLIDTKPLRGNSTLDLGLGLRYRARIGWLYNTAVTFQLNVSNLTNQYSPLIRRANKMIIAPGDPAPNIPTDGKTYVSYFMREPRAWNFSAKFQF